MEKEPVAFSRTYPELLAHTKSRLGQFLGCESQSLALIRNTTEGVNSILRSIDWAPQDEILVTNLTYPACLKAVASQSERFDVSTRVVALDPNWSDDEIVNAINTSLNRHTRLVLFDHVTSSTGLVLPVDRVIQLCRDRAVLCAIDGAHAPGMLPVNLSTLLPDFYVGNLHKWCQHPVRRFCTVRMSILVVLDQPVSAMDMKSMSASRICRPLRLAGDTRPNGMV